MLKKYFIEGLVWLITVATILGSVFATFEMRALKDMAETDIAEGWSCGNACCSFEIGGTTIVIGYCIVREDLRDSFGPLDERIPRDGRYYLVTYPYEG